MILHSRFGKATGELMEGGSYFPLRAALMALFLKYAVKMPGEIRNRDVTSIPTNQNSREDPKIPCAFADHLIRRLLFWHGFSPRTFTCCILCILVKLNLLAAAFLNLGVQLSISAFINKTFMKLF